MKSHPPIDLAHRTDLPRWLLALIALALIAGVVALLIGVRSITGMERVIGSPGMGLHDRPVIEIAQLVQEPVEQNLWGREAILDEVEVLRVLGNYTFLVGSERASVLVVLRGELTQRQPEEATEVREGQVLRIYGIVRLFRGMDEIVDITMITPGEARTIRDRRVYVSAERVVVLRDGA